MVEVVYQNPGVALVRLKLVSRVAFFTGLSAALILGLVLFYLADESGATYLDVVRAHFITHQQLGPALLLAGLFLLSLVALITWVISVYSSFRVAGPLYRFTQNLRFSHEGAAPLGIREKDCLHQVSNQLLDSLHKFDAHNRRIGELSQEAITCLQSARAGAEDEYARVVAQLKEMVGRVRVED